MRGSVISNNFRQFFITSAGITSILSKKAIADDFGVQNDGLFNLCPESINACVSSQDDRPQFFVPPWCYDGGYEFNKLKLVGLLERIKGTTLLDVGKAAGDGRYIRAQFVNPDASIDDAEFYFTPNDVTIQFRSLRRGARLSDFGTNKKRLDFIRLTLGFESVPVLRNRKSIFMFGESPLDSFGPPSIIFEKSSQGIMGVAGSCF